MLSKEENMKVSAELLKLEWTTGLTIRDRQKLTKFLTLINTFNQDDDLIGYVEAFRMLPEFYLQKRIVERERRWNQIHLKRECRIYYCTFGKDHKFFYKFNSLGRVRQILFSKVSAQFLNYFSSIDLLSREHPLRALKLIIILFCHEENFKQNEIFIGKLITIFQSYFLLDSIPLEIRLNLCILCVKN